MRLISAFVTRTLLVLVGACVIGIADAQQYPSRAITFIVPFPAGGLSDVVGRAVAQDLQKSIGAPVVVENRNGGSGTVGAAYVARSAPDGYTLLVTSVGDVTSLYFMALPYNILNDFSHVALLVEGPPLVLIINPSLPYKSVAELIAGAKANPGKLNFGSSGPGTSPSIAISQLRSMASIDIVDVPYRGVTQAAIAVLANEIQASFVFEVSAKPLLDQGRVRALATTGVHRSQAMPDVPTMIESGFPNFEYEGFVGLAAPAKTPTDVVDLLNRQVNSIVRQDAFVDRFVQSGMRRSDRNNPIDVTDYISREVKKNGELAKLTRH